MKIVLLCDSQYNQVALANKIGAQFQLSGIVIEKPFNKKKARSLSQFIEKMLNKTIFIAITNAWFGMLEHYRKEYPSFPKTNTISVDNINDEETVNFINSVKPDLLMVSGTSILKKKILSIQIPLGIINLHTGLSPYIKGSPNCTNWCIAADKMHLIGNTVMWIDAGIDSGDIIYTSLTPLTGQESLQQLHIKVMDHAHEIYLNTVKKISDDRANCPRVKQSDIITGTTYYNKDWNWSKKSALLKNLKRMPIYFNSEKYMKDKASVITVKL